MKIGIIVYSQTEHTYSVATKLKEKLLAAEHETEIEKVIPIGEVQPRQKEVKFENQPNVDAYDALIFGSPVHAFALAPAMKVYLEQIQSLQEKKIACYVTKNLPLNWTGGSQAINAMKKICESKGGSVIGTGIIVWRGGREKQIANLVDRISSLF